jgi:hypothetical protein
MKPGERYLSEVGRGGLPPRAERGGGGSPLPCLNSNNSIGLPLTEAQKEALSRLSTSHKKTAFALAQNVARLIKVYGIERVGFFTLTFADHVTCTKEAQRRFNSLNSNVLKERYAESICVLERMKSSRIHYHLLVVLPSDIRTGFDFEAAERGDYRTAGACLRAEWAFWRATAKRFGFGRTELLPVKSNEEGISKYVGKYIAKHIEARKVDDKGARLVRYSRGANACGTKFQFKSPRSRLWRWQLGEWARRRGFSDFGEISKSLGPKWAYHFRSEIIAISPPAINCGVREGPDGEREPITLQDIYDFDRFQNSVRIAEACGVTQSEAWMHLYADAAVQKAMRLDFSVPKWSGERVKRSDFECGPEALDVAIVWQDSASDEGYRFQRVASANRGRGAGLS